MENSLITFSENDYIDYKNWINLNIDGVTWQGRFEKEFDEFWQIFFVDGLSIEQIIDRFRYVKNLNLIGPLSSWFEWLKDKFLCYCFTKKNISFIDLSIMAQIRPGVLAGILRLYFLELCPHKEEILSQIFQVNSIVSNEKNITFDKIIKELRITEDIIGVNSNDIMPNLEVTLYNDWQDFLAKLRKDLFHPSFDMKKIKKKGSVKNQFMFLLEVILLVAVSWGVIKGVQYGNVWYEKYLVDKISVYEPQSQWTDKTLEFKKDSITASDKKAFELNYDEIDNIKEQKDFLDEYKEEERFETESEVVLTSIDSGHKDFDIANFEQSKYEESKKESYRDTRFGHKKVYRVMGKAIDLEAAKSSLNKLITKYHVTRGYDVKPGTLVPGGLYYNLFVPREFLQEFLAQTLEVTESILYESRTRGKNPPGKNKVFIWVKNL